MDFHGVNRSAFLFIPEISLKPAGSCRWNLIFRCGGISGRPQAGEFGGQAGEDNKKYEEMKI